MNFLYIFRFGRRTNELILRPQGASKSQNPFYWAKGLHYITDFLYRSYVGWFSLSGAPFGRMSRSHLPAPKCKQKISASLLCISKSIRSQGRHYCSADPLLLYNSNPLHFNILNHSATIVRYTSFLCYPGHFMAPGLIAPTVTCLQVGAQFYFSVYNGVTCCVFDRCSFRFVIKGTRFSVLIIWFLYPSIHYI